MVVYRQVGQNLEVGGTDGQAFVTCVVRLLRASRFHPKRYIPAGCVTEGVRKSFVFCKEL